MSSDFFDLEALGFDADVAVENVAGTWLAGVFVEGIHSAIVQLVETAGGRHRVACTRLAAFDRDACGFAEAPGMSDGRFK